MTGRTACAAALTFFLLAGITGCGDGGSPGDGPGRSGKADKAAQDDKSPEAKGGSSGEGNGGSPPSKKATALPKAADGTDTDACDDGECEVELSDGDTLRPESSFGVDQFAVQKIKDHVITWTAVFSGGRVSMSARGDDESSTSCTNGSCYGTLGKTEGTLEMNELTVEFTAIGEDRTVVKVSHK